MIKLVAMTTEEYQDYVKRSIPGYAREQVSAGSWPAEGAEARAEKAFQALLPNGTSTPNQSLNMIVDEATSEQVGILWYGVQTEEVGTFLALYDFEVFESHRRRGYGAQALEALEQAATERGIHRIALHVFGRNTAARALYQKAGYEETHITMSKKLPE